MQMKSAELQAYQIALGEGQKFYRGAVSRGEYPYLPALDYILNLESAMGYVDLGLVSIPTELIAGTKTLGRSPSLAGNFMPLMGVNTEFCTKWMDLCACQQRGEGIRDPIRCYEYLGRFYVEEGNKRVSVLSYFRAPVIAGRVTRVIPRYTEDINRRIYFEFMRFYELSGLYGLRFLHLGGYEQLQEALGFAPEHVWTEEERRSFSAVYTKFRAAFAQVSRQRGELTPAEALLFCLQMYPFEVLRQMPQTVLEQKLASLWGDLSLLGKADPIEVKMGPEPERERSGLSKLLGLGRREKMNVAFLYKDSPEQSEWSRAHDAGRAYVQQRLEDRVTVQTACAPDGDYHRAIEDLAGAGAELIFATSTEMLEECRRAATRHSGVKLLCCSLSQPFTGVHSYFARIFEAQFIAGAVTGAMTNGGEVGYLATCPFVGVPAEINAFALGLRSTNPEARVLLDWLCLPGDPMARLREQGVGAVSGMLSGGDYRDGVWMLHEAAPAPLLRLVWDWGKLYEQLILGLLSGNRDPDSTGKAVNYWWGIDSGVIDISLDPALPDGVRWLAQQLRDGLVHRAIDPFRARILDQAGQVRNDGTADFSPDALMRMDWLCGNVTGSLPAPSELSPAFRELASLLCIR